MKRSRLKFVLIWAVAILMGWGLVFLAAYLLFRGFVSFLETFED